MKIPDSNINRAKQLIWLYFWLLIIEGALRKWVVPSLSNPLLIVRDPVVILIYAVAASEGKFPKSAFIVWILGLGFFSLLASIVGLGTLVVSLYGLRTDYLHLPLIFIIPLVMTPADVQKMGKWVLLISIPMAFLVVTQFHASPGSKLNVGAGGEINGQLYAASGKIRPAGTFSFVNGMVSYLSFLAAFVLYSFLQHWPYKRLISYSAMGALGFSLLVSGSRSAVLMVSVVLIVALLACIFKGKLFSSAVKPLLGVFLVVFLLSFLPLFREGLEVQESRFESGGGFREGIVERVLGDFIAGFYAINQVPFWGVGLGIGTNAGAGLLSGTRRFLLSEGEWARVVMESGPLLGFAFIALRISILIYTAKRAMKALDRGAILPILLLGAVALDIISGQFSQPTGLGFVVLGTGLSLAAAGDVGTADETPPSSDAPSTSRIRGRSAYAEALHGKA